MAKKNRRKRKSRTELYRIRSARLKGPTYTFVSRSPVVSGGNPFGLGEYTLRIASAAGLTSRWE